MSNSLASILSPIQLDKLVESWLDEDASSFDLGGLIAGGDQIRTAILYCKTPDRVLLSGVPFFGAIFRRLDCAIQWHPGCQESEVVPDEEFITFHDPNHRSNNEISSATKKPPPRRAIASITGPIAAILRGERPALNCLSRASGIATSVDELVRIARRAGWNEGRIACTRKTTPGFRLVEKLAVMSGGGDAHRYDLSGMLMLKDNHIDACGGDFERAISKAKKLASFSTKIEVETRNLDEAMQAAHFGADVIMLDNFDAQDAKSTARVIKSKYPQCVVEISGGVNIDNIQEYFHENIDVISMGCLTQGYQCIDFSLKVVRE